MKELSIFVDESGDFGEYRRHAPYYIVTMVFHDQDIDITTNIQALNNALKQIGYGDGQAIDTEPLIRREKPYQNFLPNERRSLFSKLYHFTLNCNIKYKSFIYHKNEFNSIFKLEARIARDLSQFIQENLSYFQTYEKVILYYDNGQHELNRILNTVLATQLAEYDVRKVIPSDYRLFQVADLICTLELLKVKSENGPLSNSEQKLFHSKRDLKKDFLNGIKKRVLETQASLRAVAGFAYKMSPCRHLDSASLHLAVAGFALYMKRQKHFSVSELTRNVILIDVRHSLHFVTLM